MTFPARTHTPRKTPCSNRGLLREGYFAESHPVDPQTPFKDTGQLCRACQPFFSKGVKYVFVNGQLIPRWLLTGIMAVARPRDSGGLEANRNVDSDDCARLRPESHKLSPDVRCWFYQSNESGIEFTPPLLSRHGSQWQVLWKAASWQARCSTTSRRLWSTFFCRACCSRSS